MSIRTSQAGALLAIAALTASLSAAAPAFAAEFKAGAITVVDPQARSTAAGQPTGGGFLKIDNHGGNDRLLSASAPVAASVELHVMKMDGDVMQMRQVDAVELAAGKSVEFKPGGYHLMLMGLKAPLKAGESFPLTLKFEKAGSLTVDMKVVPAGGMAGMADMKH